MPTLIDLARQDLGQHENPPGSNVTTFGAEVGLTPAAWCMQWVSHVQRRAGVVMPADAQHPGLGWSSVGFYLGWARAHGFVSPDPAPGYSVCFDWDGNGWPDHVGFVADVYGDGSLSTIEGNASGPDGVGDEVAYHHRPRNFEVLAFVRPDLPADFPIQLASFTTPVTTPEPRNVTPYPRLTNGVALSINSPHHDLVAIYQRQMAKRGWRIGIDGLFGPQTDSITRAFQTEKRLGTDGVVGPITWRGAFELAVT